MQDNNSCCGIDCNDIGTNDMREENAFETLIEKQQQQQLLLGTRVVKMILKIDDVISPSEYWCRLSRYLNFFSMYNHSFSGFFG